MMMTEMTDALAHADLLRGVWDVKALASNQFPQNGDRYAHQFYVRVEHYEPERGGWVRYVLGDAQGIRYFSTLPAARLAACVFLAEPTMTQCVTS